MDDPNKIRGPPPSSATTTVLFETQPKEILKDIYMYNHFNSWKDHEEGVFLGCLTYLIYISHQT
jgi:hypothetical protein